MVKRIIRRETVGFEPTALPRWSYRFPFSFLCRLSFLFAGPSGRPSICRPTAHPHHAYVALRAARPIRATCPPTCLGPQEPFGPQEPYAQPLRGHGKIPPTALRAGISAFFRRKKYPLWAHFGDFSYKLSSFIIKICHFIFILKGVASSFLSGISSFSSHLCSIWAHFEQILAQNSQISHKYGPNGQISRDFQRLHIDHKLLNSAHFHRIWAYFHQF